MTHRALTIALFAALLATPAAADPCGPLTFDEGQVRFERALPVEAPLSQESIACLDQLATALLERPAIRSITIAARTPDAERAGLSALDSARAAAEHLVTRGIPAFRVSAIAPAAPADEAPALHVLYTERPRQRAVAMIRYAEGELLRGPRGDARAITSGAMVFEQDRLETGPDAYAHIILADGSELRLWEQSVLHIGPIELDAELQRQVRLDLEIGDLEILVSPQEGDAPSFKIGTRTAIAGVRGTTFRVSADDASTRLETTSGSVALASSTAPDAPVVVDAGLGSRVPAGGAPEEPRPLLPPTRVVTPLSGTITPATPLRWDANEGAASYRVELARDADFTLERAAFPTPDTELNLPAGFDGVWFWRVTAIDGDGFVGLPSQVFRVAVQPDAPEAP